jgi:hypothetical protein
MSDVEQAEVEQAATPLQEATDTIEDLKPIATPVEAPIDDTQSTAQSADDVSELPAEKAPDDLRSEKPTDDIESVIMDDSQSVMPDVVAEKVDFDEEGHADQVTSDKRWKSLGSEKELAAERVKNARPLIVYTFTKKRKYYRQELQSIPEDTIDTYKFFPSFKDPRFPVELMRRERDFGVQNVTETNSKGIQTSVFRMVNSTVQVTASDALTEEQLKMQIDPNDETLAKFLLTVEKEMSDCLIQNETIKIFKDDFNDLRNDEAFVSRKSESQLKEHQSFTHVEYSKNRRISSIHWQPKAKGIVAFSSVDPERYEKVSL